MKRKKLLHKLSDYLSLDHRAMLKKRSKIRQILKQLREKEQKLKKRALDETDEEKKTHLYRELDILRAQRLKGIRSLRALKE